MEVVPWFFGLLFVVVGLLVLVSGVLLLLGRRVPGIRWLDTTGSSTSAARNIGNARIIGMAWVVIGILGLFFGVMPMMKS